MATRGTELHDIIKEAGIITYKKDKVNGVLCQAFRAAVVGPNPQLEFTEILPSPEQPEVIPTPMEEGYKMIWTIIRKYSNSIMQRSILMTQMPASEYSDRRKWANEHKEQARRID